MDTELLPAMRSSGPTPRTGKVRRTDLCRSTQAIGLLSKGASTIWERVAEFDRVGVILAKLDRGCYAMHGRACFHAFFRWRQEAKFGHGICFEAGNRLTFVVCPR